MVSEFISKLNVSEEETNRIYEIVMNVLSSEIKNKIRHPFKSTD